MSRTIAIGDIHGCSIALEALIEAINPQPDDTIIPLGDYVDRGIDSKGVLDLLIELRDRCNLVPILGNHDQMMLHARDGRSDFQFWLNCGGDAALDSYGSSGKLDLTKDVPHIQASAEFERIPLSVCGPYVAVVSVCGRSSTAAQCPNDDSTCSQVGGQMCRVPDGSSPHPEATGWCVALSMSAPLRVGLAIPLIG